MDLRAPQLRRPDCIRSYVRTVDEARAYVRTLKAAGVDHVKVDLTTPMKAIQGATLWAAEVIGQQKDLGSVEPGKLAAFMIVEGDPLSDIGATKNVRLVIKGGEVMDTTYDPKWVNPIRRRLQTPPR